MSAERSAILNRLLRSIRLSEGEFALLLAQCNSFKVREAIMAELRSQLGAGLYLWHATPRKPLSEALLSEELLSRSMSNAALFAI